MEKGAGERSWAGWGILKELAMVPREAWEPKGEELGALARGALALLSPQERSWVRIMGLGLKAENERFLEQMREGGATAEAFGAEWRAGLERGGGEEEPRSAVEELSKWDEVWGWDFFFGACAKEGAFGALGWLAREGYLREEAAEINRAWARVERAEEAERRGAEEMERLRAKAVEKLSREEGAERLNDLLIRIVDSVGEAGGRTSRDLEASLGRSHPLLELAARGLGAQEALEAARSAGLEVPKARAFRMALARQALGGAEGSRDLAARLGVGLGEFPDAGDWVAKAAMEIWRGGWAGSGLGRERESQARAGLGWALGAGGMEAAEGGERSLRARMLDMALSDLEGGWRRWSAEDLAEMLEGDLGNWGIAGLREGEREAFAQGCGAWRERLGQAQAGGQAEEIRRDLEKLEMLARSEAPAPSRRPRRKV